MSLTIRVAGDPNKPNKAAKRMKKIGRKRKFKAFTCSICGVKDHRKNKCPLLDASTLPFQENIPSKTLESRRATSEGESTLTKIYEDHCYTNLKNPQPACEPTQLKYNENPTSAYDMKAQSDKGKFHLHNLVSSKLKLIDTDENEIIIECPDYDITEAVKKDILASKWVVSALPIVRHIENEKSNNELQSIDDMNMEEETPWTQSCDICNEHFNQRSAYRIHTRKHKYFDKHSNNSPILWNSKSKIMHISCSICKRSCLNVNMLYAHVRVHHEILGRDNELSKMPAYLIDTQKPTDADKKYSGFSGIPAKKKKENHDVIEAIGLKTYCLKDFAIKCTDVCRKASLQMPAVFSKPKSADAELCTSECNTTLQKNSVNNSLPPKKPLLKKYPKTKKCDKRKSTWNARDFIDRWTGKGFFTPKATGGKFSTIMSPSSESTRLSLMTLSTSVTTSATMKPPHNCQMPFLQPPPIAAVKSKSMQTPLVHQMPTQELPSTSRVKSTTMETLLSQPLPSSKPSKSVITYSSIQTPFNYLPPTSKPPCNSVESASIHPPICAPLSSSKCSFESLEMAVSMQSSSQYDGAPISSMSMQLPSSNHSSTSVITFTSTQSPFNACLPSSKPCFTSTQSASQPSPLCVSLPSSIHPSTVLVSSVFMQSPPNHQVTSIKPLCTSTSQSTSTQTPISQLATNSKPPSVTVCRPQTYSSCIASMKHNTIKSYSVIKSATTMLSQTTFSATPKTSSLTMLDKLPSTPKATETTLKTQVRDVSQLQKSLLTVSPSVSTVDCDEQLQPKDQHAKGFDLHVSNPNILPERTSTRLTYRSAASHLLNRNPSTSFRILTECPGNDEKLPKNGIVYQKNRADSIQINKSSNDHTLIRGNEFYSNSEHSSKQNEARVSNFNRRKNLNPRKISRRQDIFISSDRKTLSDRDRDEARFSSAWNPCSRRRANDVQLHLDVTPMLMFNSIPSHSASTMNYGHYQLPHHVANCMVPAAHIIQKDQRDTEVFPFITGVYSQKYISFSANR